MDGYSKKLSSVAAVCNFPREVESFPIRYSGTQRAVFVTEVGRTDDLSVATNDLLVKITEDKSRSRIKNRSSMALCSVTSDRSAGSCGDFQGVPKWGQNQRG